MRHTMWSNLTSNIYAIMETYNIPDILPFIAIIIIIIWPLTLHSLHSLLSILLIHWYQLCGTVHHVPKCMSCCRAILVITGRAHCFHDCIYTYNMYIYISITPILLLWDLSTLSVVDHLWSFVLRSLHSLLRTHVVHLYQLCVTVHHVPECMSCHKVIVVMKLNSFVKVQWFLNKHAGSQIDSLLKTNFIKNSFVEVFKHREYDVVTVKVF